MATGVKYLFPVFLSLICLFLSSCEIPVHSSIQKVEFTSSSHGGDKDYIHVEDFLKLHPEEVVKTREFDEIVCQSPQPLPSGLQLKPVTIAVVYPGDQVSDYWRRNLKAFVGRLDDLSIKHEVKTYFSRGGGVDTKRQVDQIKEALKYDPDYLIFTLDVQLHQKVIEQALSRKRPRIMLQNITTPLKVWEGRQPFYVGFDHVKGTELLADYFLKNNAENDRYGVLYYSLGYVSTMRGTSFIDIMRANNHLNMIASYYTDGIREKATKAALDLLKEEGVKFIYACSTDVALGARDAISQMNLTGKVMVNGWGGGSTELEALAKGELTVSVMRMNDDAGIAMAEVIRLELENRRVEIPTIFSGRFELVTNKTTNDEFAKLKKIAFRYSDD